MDTKSAIELTVPDFPNARICYRQFRQAARTTFGPGDIVPPLSPLAAMGEPLRLERVCRDTGVPPWFEFVAENDGS